ncbi:hypothetical protein AVEN_132979-1, partial [Araneus ventricosus]
LILGQLPVRYDHHNHSPEIAKQRELLNAMNNASFDVLTTSTIEDQLFADIVGKAHD